MGSLFIFLYSSIVENKTKQDPRDDIILRYDPFPLTLFRGYIIRKLNAQVDLVLHLCMELILRKL